jgi:hypothetical protein
MTGTINEVWSIKTQGGNYTSKTFKNATQTQLDAYYDKLLEVGSKLIGAQPY